MKESYLARDTYPIPLDILKSDGNYLHTKDKKYIDILQEKIKEDPIHTASGTLWIMDKDFCKQFDFINSDAFVDCSNIFKINFHKYIE